MNPFAGSLNSIMPFVQGSWPPMNVFTTMIVIETAIFTVPRHLSPRNICPRLQQAECAQTARALITDKLNNIYHARY